MAKYSIANTKVVGDFYQEFIGEKYSFFSVPAIYEVIGSEYVNQSEREIWIRILLEF